MSETPTLRERFEWLQKRALLAGLGAMVLMVVGFFLDRQAFHRSWLVAFLFWLAFPMGSMAIVMLHHLTGGSWGFAIRRLLEASMRTIPMFALLFLPIGLGIHELYEWSHEDVVANDALLQHKAPYLNAGGFWLRAVIYFALWSGLAWLLNRLSSRYDQLGGRAIVHRMRAVSGPGIGLYVLTMSFASFDWAMSLEPHWFSTLYGLVFVVGQGLTTLAFAVVIAAWLSRMEPFARWVKAHHFHDVGKLMFAFVMLWAYVHYSQYLIIWSGNLAEETPFYLNRESGGWQAIAIFLAVFHFALPFFVLLSKGVKRNARTLAYIALGLLFLRWVDLHWLITPAFHPGHLSISWMDIVAPVAIGGLWVAALVGQLKGRPLVSLQDAQLQGQLELQPAPAGAPTTGAES